LYFWAHTVATDWSGEQYLVTNKSGTTDGPATISTGQGFFVTASDANNATITFNNSLRETGNNDTFLRPASGNQDKIWLNVASNNDKGCQILLAFNNICTDGFDAQYDASQFNNANDISFYSNGVGANTDKLAIQTRGLLADDDTIVPLGVIVNDDQINNVTISIDHLENLTNEDIYLKDNLLNTVTNLKEGNYSFTISQTGDINNRFELLFSRNTLSLDQIKENTNITIAQNANVFIVNATATSKIKQVEVYNMIGQQVENVQKTASTIEIPNNKYAKGTILIFKATLDNGSVISKKVIKM